jgi:hypothetical protein
MLRLKTHLITGGKFYKAGLYAEGELPPGFGEPEAHGGPETAPEQLARVAEAQERASAPSGEERVLAPSQRIVHGQRKPSGPSPRVPLPARPKGGSAGGLG